MSRLSIRQQKLIRAIHSRKGRAKHQACLVEGERSIEAAIAAGAPVRFVVHTEEQAQAPVVEQARQAGISVHESEEAVLSALSDVQTSSGLLAVSDSFLVDAGVISGLQTVLVLEGVQDPGNAGTLIRTASWFGVQGVLATAGTVDLLSPKVMRSAMGGCWDVRLGHTESFDAWASDWKNRGGKVVVTQLSGLSLGRWVPDPKTALVIGSEARGVSPVTAGLADTSITIPSPTADISTRGVESLNAGIAGGIAMSHWLGDSGQEES